MKNARIIAGHSSVREGTTMRAGRARLYPRRDAVSRLLSGQQAPSVSNFLRRRESFGGDDAIDVLINGILHVDKT